MDQNNTKRGVASLYVVIFATILFGVVTLSFMRIILSDAGQTSDDDLSRSAYDSAMAGVEDAKTAINKYYQCISSGNGDCGSYGTLFKSDCDDGIGIAQYLYQDGYNPQENNGEVKIQESSSNNSDQAYTCVILSDEVPDYRGTLTNDTRTKIIPLAVYNGSNNTNSNLSSVTSIKFDWFSILNQGTDDLKRVPGGNNPKTLNSADNKTVPPTISLTFIRMASGAVGATEFNNANDTPNKLEYDTVILLPSESSDPISLSAARAGNVNKEERNEPFRVECNKSNSEFACSATIGGLPAFNSSDTVLLVVSLPYGDAYTDFAATMYGQDGAVKLKGAQISVDSTGRTNQLVRRVETRLDPADLFFPYPQYELDLSGDGDKSLLKSFWITANCWKSDKGNANTCNNNGKFPN